MNPMRFLLLYVGTGHPAGRFPSGLARVVREGRRTAGGPGVADRRWEGASWRRNDRAADGVHEWVLHHRGEGPERGARADRGPPVWREVGGIRSKSTPWREVLNRSIGNIGEAGARLPGLDLCSVRLETVGQLLRVAERHTVTSVDLVRSDPEAFVRDPPEEGRREQAVVTAEQHTRWDVGPRRQGPGLAPPSQRGGPAPFASLPTPAPGERRGKRSRSRRRPVRPPRSRIRCSPTSRPVARPARGSCRRPARAGPPSRARTPAER